jgi:hypothetical protein
VPGQSVVGVDWTASSTGDTELATGYFSALLEKGEYDRTNLATTITDKLQYAQPRFGQTFLDANNDFLRRSDNYWHTDGFDDIADVNNASKRVIIMGGTYANIDEFIKKTSINFGTALTVYAWVTPQGGVKTFKYLSRVVENQYNDGIYILNNVATLYMTADFWSEHDKVEDGYVEVNITGLANYPFTDIPAVVDEDRVTMMTPYPDAPSFTNFTGIAVGGKIHRDSDNYRSCEVCRPQQPLQ